MRKNIIWYRIAVVFVTIAALVLWLITVTTTNKELRHEAHTAAFLCTCASVLLFEFQLLFLEYLHTKAVILEDIDSVVSLFVELFNILIPWQACQKFFKKNTAPVLEGVYTNKSFWSESYNNFIEITLIAQKQCGEIIISGKISSQMNDSDDFGTSISIEIKNSKKNKEFFWNKQKNSWQTTIHGQVIDCKIIMRESFKESGFHIGTHRWVLVIGPLVFKIPRGLKGLKENIREIKCYYATKHRLLARLYLPLILINIYQRERGVGKIHRSRLYEEATKIEQKIHNDKLEDIGLILSITHSADIRNFSFNGKRVKIIDYGKENLQESLEKYGDMIEEMLLNAAK